MSEKINDGGPAFACASCDGYQEGMSMRDWFAGKSIDAAFEMESRNPTYTCNGSPSFKGVSERAYILADAMLKAREVKT